MDWIRRNWPDLLIAVLLVAVILGIVMTLLTGGSVLPSFGGGGSRSDAPPIASTPTTRPPVATPADPADPVPTERPGMGSAPDAPGAATGAGDPPPVQPEAPDDASGPATGGATDGTEDGTTSGAADAEGPGISPLPPVGGESGTPPASTPAPPATSTPVIPPTSAPDAPADAGAASRPSTSSSAPSETVPGTDAPYRVSVGAFSSAENAQRQAEAFRERGFPVFIGVQGDLSLVLVGPYAEAAEAEAAAERIRAAGDAATIYRLQEDTVETTIPATPAPSAGGTPAEGASAPTVDAGVPTATAGGSYLQVGAYGSVASSLPQRERLEALGFPVEQRTEGGLVKLLVGPFAGADLAAARARLDERGIDHFVR